MRNGAEVSEQERHGTREAKEHREGVEGGAGVRRRAEEPRRAPQTDPRGTRAESRLLQESAGLIPYVITLFISFSL